MHFDPNVSRGSGDERPALLPLRATLVLLLAVLSGLGCAVLMIVADRSLPEAALGAAAAAGAALKLFHELID